MKAVDKILTDVTCPSVVAELLVLSRMRHKAPTQSLILLYTMYTAPAAVSRKLSEENIESSETSPDLSPLHAVLSCGMIAVHDDPSKCLVKPGRPTRIAVCKGKSGLGMKVIGGSDTNLVSICDT